MGRPAFWLFPRRVSRLVAERLRGQLRKRPGPGDHHRTPLPRTSLRCGAVFALRDKRGSGVPAPERIRSCWKAGLISVSSPGSGHRGHRKQGGRGDDGPDRGKRPEAVAEALTEVKHVASVPHPGAARPVRRAWRAPLFRQPQDGGHSRTAAGGWPPPAGRQEGAGDPPDSTARTITTIAAARSSSRTLTSRRERSQRA